MNPLFESWRLGRAKAGRAHRKFLRRLASVKAKRLDALAAEVDEQVFNEIDCLDCANCCTSIPPIVNDTDARRLAKRLGLGEAAFAEAYLTTDEDGDRVMNRTPCPFLGEGNLCAVYDVRPKACRQYPYTGEDFSKHFNLHAENAQYCPAVFHILERMAQIG